MKKFILMFVMAFMTMLSANAQVATENAKLFDNVYVGVEVGATTPLNFNSILPLNTLAGVKIGKELTPVVGLEVEGLVAFNDNNFVRWTETLVKSTNVGLNGTINLSNLFLGYKGTPRVFEIKTNTGLGWLHYWNTSVNALTAKTAADFNFNLGKTRAHTLGVTAGVWWNLNPTDRIQFNKQHAQLAVLVGYTYHFKTSNGTRHFKTYDVGALQNEITRLNEELAKKPKVVEKVVEKVVVAAPETTNTVNTVADTKVYVFFAQNSSVLTDEAKAVLDKVIGTVEVVASASPEGTATYNQELSERRAATVTDYLTQRGVTVTSQTGLGVTGETSGRIAIVTTVK